MMFNFPFMNSPFYRRYNNYSNPYRNFNPSYNGYMSRPTDCSYSNYKNGSNCNNNFNSNNNCNNDYHKSNAKDNCSNSSTQKNVPSKKEDCTSSDDAQCFEIFGIRLYFDDILIICLLFFLYNEGVKDQSLFIALIMLLLS